MSCAETIPYTCRQFSAKSCTRVQGQVTQAAGLMPYMASVEPFAVHALTLNNSTDVEIRKCHILRNY